MENAAGQLFGYTLQFPRALLRLIQANVGAKVGIEVCGDIAVFFPGKGILSEESKSSLTDNALTDLSSNLWKTFYNWVNAIKASELNVSTDWFVLYTNHPVTEGSLVTGFNHAKNGNVDEVVARASNVLARVTQGHELFQYKHFLFEENQDCFAQLLKRFELVVDNHADDVYSDIRMELQKQAVEKRDVEDILKSLTGWFQEVIMEKISKRSAAIVSKEEFLHELRPLLGKLRRKELIDYAVSKMPSSEDIVKSARQRPVYVRQLESIRVEDEEIIASVSDYFRAFTNRQDWIEHELVDEDDMKDLVNKLCSFHANKQKTIELTLGDKPEETRGRILLNECQERQETISGQVPPDRTIHGTYHVLADEERVFWHPRWKELEHKDYGG